MNISINCKLSLSKKLRALLGKEASLTLVSQDVVDGKGNAILTLTSEGSNPNINPEEIGETSIMLIPVEIADEAPNSSSPVHASIFSTIPQKGNKSPVTQKLAVVHAPEEGDESTAVKEVIEIPQQFEELKNKECKKWIQNMEELVVAANLAKSKRSSIDLSSAQNDRERAIMMEAKEKDESIDSPAWIVNSKAGMLSVNDLNISLPLNAPFDLSNISAKRIIASRDLKMLLREGFVKFLSPKEKDRYILEIAGELETSSGLPVFDNHEEAMDSMEENHGKTAIIDEESAMEVGESDISKPTEDESMIVNLTQNMPTVKNRQPIEGSRKTVHGNTSNTSTPTTSKNPAIKPIRKIS